MKSMGHPDYVYQPHTEERRAKQSAAMKKVIAERFADGRGWTGKLWSAEDEEVLNFMYDEGMRRDEIGQALNRSTAATRAKLEDTSKANQRRARFQTFRREGRKTDV